MLASGIMSLPAQRLHVFQEITRPKSTRGSMRLDALLYTTVIKRCDLPVSKLQTYTFVRHVGRTGQVTKSGDGRNEWKSVERRDLGTLE